MKFLVATAAALMAFTGAVLADGTNPANTEECSAVTATLEASLAAATSLGEKEKGEAMMSIDELKAACAAGDFEAASVAATKARQSLATE